MSECSIAYLRTGRGWNVNLIDQGEGRIELLLSPCLVILTQVELVEI